MKKWSVGISWGVSLELDVDAETEELAGHEAMRKLREEAARLRFPAYGHTVDIDFVKEVFG